MPSKDASDNEGAARRSSPRRSTSPLDDSNHKRKRSITPSSSLASSSSRSLSRSPPPKSRTRRRTRSPSLSDAEARGARQEGAAREDADRTAARTAQIAEKGDALRTTLAKLSATKAGGAYIPPARLKALMAEAAAADPGSVEFQRMSWDALKKSITGLVNKVAVDNIKQIVPELFGGANLVRGRGLYCRSIMRAQSLSIPFTPVFAALTAIVNTKLPMVGELLLTRLASQFRRSFKRNDKAVCNSTATFIAHLVNQRVVHEVIALEILVLLLEKPTDDSVEIAVGFMREVGAYLTEEAPKANNSIFDRFRAVLYEGDISKRVQYMIEVLSQVRREGFKDNPRIPEALDLVEEDDQITHRVGLDDKLEVEEGLNVFKKDPDFLENEDRYQAIKKEILGEDSDGDSGSDADSESGSSSDTDGSDDEEQAQQQVEIQDRTETNLINLRRTIYLTIMSSLDFEESVHKLLKLQIPEGQDIELCNMIVECCSQERTYSKFYGNMGERFCKLSRNTRNWSHIFELSFRNYYDTIHRYETNRLRNIGRFFGHLISTDSISWSCFQVVHMNEEDTTSSSRIFVKILMQELQQQLGLKTLAERFCEPSMQEQWQGLFPTDYPKNTRFSINYFTSIGMGVLTEGMREYLKNAPKLLLAQREAALKARGSGSDTDSSSHGLDLIRGHCQGRDQGRTRDLHQGRGDDPTRVQGHTRDPHQGIDDAPIRARGLTRDLHLETDDAPTHARGLDQDPSRGPDLGHGPSRGQGPGHDLIRDHHPSRDLCRKPIRARNGGPSRGQGRGLFPRMIHVDTIVDVHRLIERSPDRAPIHAR